MFRKQEDSSCFLMTGKAQETFPDLISGLENTKFHILNYQRKNPAEAGFRKHEVSLVSIIHWENDTEYLRDQLITA